MIIHKLHTLAVIVEQCSFTRNSYVSPAGKLAVITNSIERGEPWRDRISSAHVESGFLENLGAGRVTDQAFRALREEALFLDACQSAVRFRI